MTHPAPTPARPVMVTQAILPPFEEYAALLRGIWDRHWLTNNGPLQRELEETLRARLGVEHLWFVNNGTTALQLAIAGLGLSGEVITTPFSYVATAGSLLWEHCTPVFVDVRASDLTLDPTLVEAALTPRTTAILATHVYGFPCDDDALADIAKRRGLRLIYDAAHAFGCSVRGRSLASLGDISCLSFHATKVFHTVEGGAVVINCGAEVAETVRLKRAFGHHGDDHRCVGINGKNSELHAAMGLANLPRFEAHVATRKILFEQYRDALADIAVTPVRSQNPDLVWNYGYCPVLLPDEGALLAAVASLATHDIHPRRYFFPSLNRIGYVQGAPCPVSESAASRVLCLPLSPLVTEPVLATIAHALLAAAGKA